MNTSELTEIPSIILDELMKYYTNVISDLGSEITPDTHSILARTRSTEHDGFVVVDGEGYAHDTNGNKEEIIGFPLSEQKFSDPETFTPTNATAFPSQMYMIRLEETKESTIVRSVSLTEGFTAVK